MSELPPYSERPPVGSTPSLSSVGGSQVRTRIAGNIQTCSIADMQHDYLKIIRDSDTSYRVCLPVDSTTLYHVDISEDPTALWDVAIYDVNDGSRIPVAATQKSKNPMDTQQGIFKTCADSLLRSNANWYAFRRAMAYQSKELKCEFTSSTPIVPSPGLDSVMVKWIWRTMTTKPFWELWWTGPLHFDPSPPVRSLHRDPRYLFATCESTRVNSRTYPSLLRIRRGGGLAFELTVLLQVFCIARV